MTFPISFTSKLIDHAYGSFPYVIAPLPGEVASIFPIKTRLKGVCNGINFNLAILNSDETGPYLIINNALRKPSGATPGSNITITLLSIADPDELDIPEAWTYTLEDDPEAKAGWERMTTGLQRSLLHYLNSAKREETLIKRCIMLADRFRTGYYDQHVKDRIVQSSKKVK